MKIQTRSLSRSLWGAVIFGLMVGVCGAKKNKETRSILPYLKYRTGSSFATGTNKLGAVAWHPTESLFAMAGGPRDGVLPELALYTVAGNSTGANINDVDDLIIGGNIIINSVAWSPNGKYFALGASNIGSKQLKVYSYANQSLASLTTATWGSTGSSSVNSVAWHPSGNYLAVAGANQTSGYEVIVYSFTPTATTPLVAVANLNLGSGVTAYSVAWHPTNNCLAIGCGGPAVATTQLQVYQFSTSANTLTNVNMVNFGGSTTKFGGVYSSVQSVAWSPNGNYLAAGGFSVLNNNQVKVYSASSAGVLTALSAAVVNFGNYIIGSFVDSVAWDPQGSYLAIGGFAPADKNELAMYAFDGATLTPKIGTRLSFGSVGSAYVSGIAWQPSRKYVLVGGYAPYNGKELWVMEFINTATGINI